ncbi:hypothetical protein OB919_11080 [Halobacteria archaeon AArc-curdl1]|uniref:Uncharacterized protein n=1 Tax=Natronosalvus hydrolyticus TaxID=2979988 RepID=A0AAP2Z8I4_9EURY|nr:hypothetical protein [Halobacteria archaeon AArc-curdl1]
MSTEIRSINRYSVIRIALPLGAVSGLIGVLPFVFDFMAARTPGRFFIDFSALIVASAVTTAILAVVFVTVYNLVAKYYGGIEVTLS